MSIVCSTWYWYVISKKAMVVHGKKMHMYRKVRRLVRNNEKMYEGAADVVLGTLY